MPAAHLAAMPSAWRKPSPIAGPMMRDSGPMPKPAWRRLSAAFHRFVARRPQPMHSARAAWSSSNGEIYNAPELSRELAAEGVAFRAT
jgi:hypothetical protein